MAKRFKRVWRADRRAMASSCEHSAKLRLTGVRLWKDIDDTGSPFEIRPRDSVDTRARSSTARDSQMFHLANITVAPDRGGGDGDRHPQHGVGVEQGAARQFGAAFGGAGVCRCRDGRMTAEQFERLKAELESSYQGAKHAGRPLLLEGGLDWKPLSLSPKDMDLRGDFQWSHRGEARRGARDRSRSGCAAVDAEHRFAMMLFGIPGDNTYSNYQEAQRAFWRGTVLPLVWRTAKAISAWLAPAWETSLEFKPDLDEVAALTGEREQLWARLNAASF